ncbi:NUDIX hydrolase [Streptomyces rectiviolaceus]|uniref:NUDIX hydrolase n=1 Tax=Streptomyces rectiviolaceus TaxID=332591 RepID=UPI00362A85A4
MELKPLAPLARTIAETVRDTPVQLGAPEGAADLVAMLTVKVAAYVGGEMPETPGLARHMAEVDAERQRQIAKFGDQHHPDGTGNQGQQEYAETKRSWCEAAFGSGYGTWADILAEEVAEVEAERDHAKLRDELVQVAAVCAAWIADIDSRAGRTP